MATDIPDGLAVKEYREECAVLHRHGLRPHQVTLALANAALAERTAERDAERERALGLEIKCNTWRLLGEAREIEMMTKLAAEQQVRDLANIRQQVTDLMGIIAKQDRELDDERFKMRLVEGEAEKLTVWRECAREQMSDAAIREVYRRCRERMP